MPALARGTRVQPAASSSTAEVEIGAHAHFAISADQDITVRFGITAMDAADATDFRITAGVVGVFGMGPEFTHFRAFNLSSTTAANIHYLPLSKF